MERNLYKNLLAWKQQPRRKPLILRGVRQVGKTYLLRVFGERAFSRCHYVNFEKERDAHKIFQQDLNPRRIVEELALFLRGPIDRQNDLVIFDEVQACPDALTSIKYFCEDMPELALCAAGSLLGIHLNTGSYPVGKVDELTLFPLSFEEFLWAVGEQPLLDCLQAAGEGRCTPVPEVAHVRLWRLLTHYFVVGGLPEVVGLYCSNRAELYKTFRAVRERQNTLLRAYYADMAKHAGKVNAMHLDRLWRAVPEQLARGQTDSSARFRFKGVVPGIDRYSRLVHALDWLEGAGLVIKVRIAHTARMPLGAHTKESLLKLFMFDVGMLGAMAELPPETLLGHDYGSYKGYFAENFVAQELLCAGVERLYAWQEQTAEIEFLCTIAGQLIPIEVKSGRVTQAKSLKVFDDKYHPSYKIILSAKNLLIDEQRRTHYYPLYLAGRIPQCVIPFLWG